MVATITALVTSSAFACVNLATLTVTPGSGTARTRVTATGSSYATRPGFPVVLHWNGVDGPELGRALPDDHGNISIAFTVPQASAGWYVVIAVQRDNNGADIYGTPSRASIELLAPGQSPSPTAPSSAPTVAPPPAPPPTPPPATRPSVPSTTRSAPTTSPPTSSTPAQETARPLATQPSGRGGALPSSLVVLALVLLAAATTALVLQRALRSRTR